MSTVITVAHPSTFSEENQTRVPNHIIDNPNMSAMAKILLIYLIRQVRDWKFHDEAIKNFLDCGRTSLEKYFRQLRENGYCKLEYIQDENGLIIGSKRIFARDPIYSPITKNNNKINDRTEAPKTGAPVNRGSGKWSPTNIRNNNRDTLVSNISNVLVPREAVTKTQVLTPTQPSSDIGVKNASAIAAIVKQPVITQTEVASIRKRLVAIKKANELHANYKNQSLDDLCAEIIFHVSSRNQVKCTHERALNFAVKAIKTGRWTTPKGITRKREEAQMIEKQNEIVEAKRSPINKLLTEAATNSQPTTKTREYLIMCLEIGVDLPDAEKAIGWWGMESCFSVAKRFYDSKRKINSDIFIRQVKELASMPKSIGNLLGIS